MNACDELTAHLRVFTDGAALTGLCGLLPAFLSANERVRIELQETPNMDVVCAVHNGRADIGVVAGACQSLGLQAIRLGTDRMVLITGRHHRFARRKSIDFSATLTEDFAGIHPGSTMQSLLEQQAEKLGIPMRLSLRLRSLDTVCRMVVAGVCVAIIPRTAALHAEDRMKLAQIELTDCWTVFERRVLMRDLASLPAYARDLVERIQLHSQGSEIAVNAESKSLAKSRARGKSGPST